MAAKLVTTAASADRRGVKSGCSVHCPREKALSYIDLHNTPYVYFFSILGVRRGQWTFSLKNISAAVVYACPRAKCPWTSWRPPWTRHDFQSSSSSPGGAPD